MCIQICNKCIKKSNFKYEVRELQIDPNFIFSPLKILVGKGTFI